VEVIMSKNKKPILFDDIEWGNQELPHLSHDEIMNKNWQYVKTGRDYEKWKESIDNRTANEQWRKNVAKGNQNKEKQKEFVKKRQIGIDKRTASYEWQVANAKQLQKDIKILNGGAKILRRLKKEQNQCVSHGVSMKVLDRLVK